MPRKYIRKTDHLHDRDALEAAFNAWKEGTSIRKAAKSHNIATMTLMDAIKRSRKQKGEMKEDIEYVKTGFKNRMVFTEDMEVYLAAYLLTVSKMFHGLTPMQTRSLAYQYGKENGVRYPASWIKNQLAGKDWFTGFMERNKSLSIRSPEATTYARMTAFNPHNLKVFMDNLKMVMERNNFSGNRIYNLDETGVTTAPKIPKVVGPRGAHQVGQVSSRERGELVTMVGIINASGNHLPPIFVFPRHRFDERKMMSGASDGSLGLVHSSGWMTSENFIHALKHLCKFAKASPEDPILLVMDNHESHISYLAVEFAKMHGVVILTLPPHTSNKLQPLDVSVFGPFKSYYNSKVQGWMINNPGKLISIYEIPKLACDAWIRAACPVNITSGFRATGISPFNTEIFSDSDFLGAFVSDRPIVAIAADAVQPNATATLQLNATTPSISNTSPLYMPHLSTPSTSTAHTTLLCGKESTVGSLVSPEMIRPYPKAAARKQSNRGRNRGKCMVATDTPEKLRILEKHNKRIINQEKLKQAKKRKLFKELAVDEGSSSSSSESSGPEMQQLMDDSSVYSDEFETISDWVDKQPAKDDYVLVRLQPTNLRDAAVCYVGQLLTDKVDQKYKTSYLRMTKGKLGTTFQFPIIVDEDEIDSNAILHCLPDPVRQKTKRSSCLLKFNVSFDGYNMR